MAYLIANRVFIATRSLERFWSSIFDPVGLRLFDGVTRYWTVAEKNTLLLHWTGIFLYNRLLWLGVGLASLVTVYAFFPFSIEVLTAASQGRRAARARASDPEEARLRPSFVAGRLPNVHQVFGPATTWAQFASLTRLRISNILRELPFWAIVGVMVVYAAISDHFAGRFRDTNVYPVTFLVLQAVQGISFLFFLIIAAMYAGELIWRERETHFDNIHDALPIKASTDWLSKFFALASIEFLLLTVVLLCGVVTQTLAGYHHYEFVQYFKELYLITFPQVMMYVLLALFVQTVVSNKFIAHAVVIGVFVLDIALFNFGWENTLYLFGQTPPYVYSDMNGYGHFVPALFWATTYWLSISALLGVLSIAFAWRGADDSWRARLRLARERAPRLVPVGALFLLLAAASGGWYYYNAHVLNEYLNSKARRDIAAEYERNFKKYEGIPQPKILSVGAAVDIFPESRAFTGTGHYLLQNKTAVPISEVHVVDAQHSVSTVRFDRPFHLVSSSPRNLYSIYALETPLRPGEKLNMDFALGYATHGFTDGNERPEFALSGTFFDSSYFPEIGYTPDIELTDPRRRRDEHLGPVSDLPRRGDPVGSSTNLFTPQADWVAYQTVLSTPDDQVALAPGYPTREWHQNGRHYYEYSMGDLKIQDFFAYVSGRYNVRRESYPAINGNVNIEVYSAPAHPYDVDDMVAATKAGLAYYESSFSPFQFRQFRILEFPRYRSFAQSFANTVPYAEFGFITRVVSPDDIDFTYFVTAHELAHQWWGHQLIGARVEGSNMMSESLAEYSALRVMQKKYGDDHMRKFLKHELDGYLRGRAGESNKETPLDLVQRESYVWYQKGSLVLYALSDYIGEDKLNLALRNFLMQHRYANAEDSQSGPYPDTRQFVQALRDQTPPELQYYIDDAFESIVLYDNRAVTATVTPTADKKFKVVLTVASRKFKADGLGTETPMPLNDYVEIGVFSGKKDHEVPLYLRKEKITGEKQTFEVVVDQMPTRAGIDPYNKLIDRISDDNIIDVSSL